MEILKDYEKEVLNLLVSDVLSSDKLNIVINNGEVFGYEYTGSGYFLGIQHSLLPKERIVCSEPIVIGEADDITCGFVVFIEDNQLTIESHSWGELNVPEDFREKNVQVRVADIGEVKVIDLRQVSLTSVYRTNKKCLKTVS
jgi:hypothetical protein